MATEKAYFATGCFWCTEAIFQKLKGVTRVTPGYSGGEVADPTYEEVCTGTTGHAECIEIEFNPEAISYSQLLEIFWYTHDPTTLNRQGNDIGTQYRSAIFFLNETQREQAEQSKQALESSHAYDSPIVTEITQFEKFYPAEDYHKDYFTKNPDQGYCQVIISPKVTEFRQKYLNLLRED